MFIDFRDKMTLIFREMILERGRESETPMWETSIGCLLDTPWLGSNPQPFDVQVDIPTNYATWPGQGQKSLGLWVNVIE